MLAFWAALIDDHEAAAEQRRRGERRQLAGAELGPLGVVDVPAGGGIAGRRDQVVHGPVDEELLLAHDERDGDDFRGYRGARSHRPQHAMPAAPAPNGRGSLGGRRGGIGSPPSQTRRGVRP